MTDKDLYNEANRLFRYDTDTGLLYRKIAVMNFGKPNPMPRCKAGDVVGNATGNGYLRVCVQGKNHLIHRLIWLMVTGGSPKEHIDHINGIKTDNRWCNLREASHAENQRNRGIQSNNTIGFKGVSASGTSCKNPYKAKIRSNGKAINLGNFPTPELAYEAYCNAVFEHHKEFAHV